MFRAELRGIAALLDRGGHRVVLVERGGGNIRQGRGKIHFSERAALFEGVVVYRLKSIGQGDPLQRFALEEEPDPDLFYFCAEGSISPTETTLSGIVTSFSSTQNENAEAPIEVTLEGIETDLRRFMPEKA